MAVWTGSVRFSLRSRRFEYPTPRVPARLPPRGTDYRPNVREPVRVVLYVVGVIALVLVVIMALGGMGVGDDNSDKCPPGRYETPSGDCIDLGTSP